MPLRLAILALPALALVPTIAPPRAPRAAQLFSVVERGTSSLEDTEGLGAEFEDALVDDAAWDTEESGDEDLLAGFDLENADAGDIKEWPVTPLEIASGRAAAKAAHARHDTDCGSSEVRSRSSRRASPTSPTTRSQPKDHASRGASSRSSANGDA